jgi:hypothetical protein
VSTDCSADDVIISATSCWLASAELPPKHGALTIRFSCIYEIYVLLIRSRVLWQCTAGTICTEVVYLNYEVYYTMRNANPL